MCAARLNKSGFTVAELITVVAIIGILASVALPVARIGTRRQKEIELRTTLRRITEAIDHYHELRVAGAIQTPPYIGQGEYPRSLDELVEGVELTPMYGKRIRFLRQRDLIDPMTGRSEWRTLSDTDDAGTLMTDGNNVYAVHSTSSSLSLDGKTHYSEW
ncbi:MAG TPA: prepilin-type N-terminal cleavage/methylation domain-containing protein [Thermoanaerobaculia bacterium]|nr:prepilin-type N-terminal cleavage/methylation domain-containing protein [Thermoanaerobaculia bacterium]